VPQSRRNYTGPELEATGLLSYNARYYDPALARFISADTIVPGSGPLTVAPNDAVATSAWAARGGGPNTSQDLHRHSYSLNNSAPVLHDKRAKHTPALRHYSFLCDASPGSLDYCSLTP
jgi:RHS repeat-associated protein